MDWLRRGSSLRKGAHTYTEQQRQKLTYLPTPVALVQDILVTPDLANFDRRASGR